MKQSLVVLLCLISVVVIASIAHAAPTFQIDLIYEVQQGDTLFDLARKFNLKVSQIREVNNLAEDEVIRVEDKIIIPEVNSSKFNQKAEGKEKIALYQPRNKTEEYSLNHKQQYKIKLKKESSRTATDINNLRTLNYYVRAGDNIYDLAREFKTSIKVLKEINNLDKSSMIRRGDKIKLPINNLTDKEVLQHTISDQELELLARLIHGEARGESYLGQVAVGAVILNRVLSSYFPDNIKAVIYQPGQFSPVADGQINLHPNRMSYRAARAALQGEDPTRGACYFYNPQTANHMWWFESREVVVEIGNHVFAK
ncbi:MAG: cell wall hydrolase [Bacillota bacterium]